MMNYIIKSFEIVIGDSFDERGKFISLLQDFIQAKKNMTVIRVL